MSDIDSTAVSRPPSVSRVLESPPVREALSTLPRSLILEAIREEIEALRVGGTPLGIEDIAVAAVHRARLKEDQGIRPAINATGVILHTGLGRAVLAPSAVDAVTRVAAGHSTLEIDLETGRRGSRQAHASEQLRTLTGAEDALILNNNAGATFLSVAALAADREVIISRGELVEIGGSFRMPDIIRASGAVLVEVGTTNRTRLADYESAVTEHTGLILRCHPSNFKQVGFTEETPVSDLVALGRRVGVPVMDDLGSGAMVDTAASGGASAATLQEAAASGCDVVTASGDKLLGGPQAGIVLGSAAAVRRIAGHPLARALRVDKLTLAALEATLRLYLDEDRARREVPTLRYLSRTGPELREMADSLLDQVRTAAAGEIEADIVPSTSQIGGGSLPGENLPTFCVRLRSCDPRLSVDELSRRLRTGTPAIFGRIHEGALLLDPRTLEESDFGMIAQSLAKVVTA